MKSHQNITDLFAVLKSLLGRSSSLQRLSLFFDNMALPKGSDHSQLANFFVQFVLKMKHLFAVCVTFDEFDSILKEEVDRRIVEEVLPNRPALWFHLGTDTPNAVDPGVPLVHYYEMVHIDLFSRIPEVREFSLGNALPELVALYYFLKEVYHP